MSKRIFIDGNINSELCIIATDGQEINYFDYSDELIASKKNNIYLGIVSRVEPSLQAAFIDFGSEKKAFLPFDEIHPSYFKIPHNEKIIETDNDKTTNETDEKQNKKHFLSFYRKYKIQDVIKKDQVLLIQIVKEERGTKGAAITTFISLPGRYSVLLPNNSSNGGVSKKIANPLDRKRLKKLHDGFNLPDGMSIIIRTNAISAEDEDIIADFNYLRKLWTKIREETLKSKAPKLISELDTPIIKVARDLNQRSVDEIIFSDLKTMKEYKKLESEFSVNKKKITHYKEKLPLFESYGIKNPINTLSEENIYMKSGGYLVINPTEALTSVDINSGRSTSEKNIEITALNTNLEACDEIFKQVQLRNIAGLIVIDFIDMSINGNNNKVERKIKELFYKDRARVQLTKISQFGLMEISRQRIGQSIYETFFKKCECCNGNGLRKTKSIIIHNIITLIKNLNSLDKTKEYEINIDKSFFGENKIEIIKRIKSLKLKFDVKFIEIEENLIHKIFEVDQKIVELINNKSKENIIKNTTPENNSEKSYRRKIKKKIVEDIT